MQRDSLWPEKTLKSVQMNHLQYCAMFPLDFLKYKHPREPFTRVFLSVDL